MSANYEHNTEEDAEIDFTNRTNMRKKIAVATILVSLIVLVILDSFTNNFARNAIDVFLEWINANPIPGFFAFVLVYFLATVFFIPGSILTLAAGFVFAKAFGLGIGVLFASLAAFLGASSGAIVSFILGRYILRDWVVTLTTKYPKFEALDNALKEKGFRIMALLRLSPIIPFNALNYMAGITGISLVAYTFACLAMIPGTIAYVFLGASAGSLSESSSGGDNKAVRITTIVIGVAFGLIAIFVASYYAKIELNKLIESQQEETGDNHMDGARSEYDNENQIEEANASYTSLDDTMPNGNDNNTEQSRSNVSTESLS